MAALCIDLANTLFIGFGVYDFECMAEKVFHSHSTIAAASFAYEMHPLISFKHVTINTCVVSCIERRVRIADKSNIQMMTSLNKRLLLNQWNTCTIRAFIN